jgi:RNA polymerase sigma factor
MDEQQLKDLIDQAQQGDRLSRERIIRHFKTFVLNVASRVTKRYLTWSDEESSIGLTALNKAIDHFNHRFGKNFISYSYLIISREIIDFFRREKRHQHLSLQEPLVVGEDQDLAEETPYECDEAEKRYALHIEQSELIQEILIYQSELDQYGLSFEDLPELSPKHQDSRENCFKLASVMVETPDLIAAMQRKKRLPIADLSRASGVPAKTIEKHRKYILAVTICLLHPDLERLRSYIKKGGDEHASE